MKKYIQRSATGSPGTKWHSYPRCKTLNPEAKVIVAPESMLKAYGITEKCAVCEALDQKKARKDDESDLRDVIPLLISTSIVVEKQVRRDFLRSELLKRDIPYTLRQPKIQLARKLCKAWFREKNYQTMIDIVSEALAHWQNRIDVKDLHRPAYYVEMRDRSRSVLEGLKKLQEVQNGSV